MLVPARFSEDPFLVAAKGVVTDGTDVDPVVVWVPGVIVAPPAPEDDVVADGAPPPPAVLFTAGFPVALFMFPPVGFTVILFPTLLDAGAPPPDTGVNPDDMTECVETLD